MLKLVWTAMAVGVLVLGGAAVAQESKTAKAETPTETELRHKVEQLEALVAQAQARPAPAAAPRQAANPGAAVTSDGFSKMVEGVMGQFSPPCHAANGVARTTFTVRAGLTNNQLTLAGTPEVAFTCQVESQPGFFSRLF